MLKGFQGVQQFQQRRIMALQRSQQSRTDCFHNDSEVLPEVRAWHSHLRTCISNVDRITGPLLYLIDRELLQVDRDLRPSANVLCYQLMQILQNATAASPSIANEILRAELQPLEIESEDTFETAQAPSQLLMDMLDFSSGFWDSAIGMDVTESANMSCLDNDILPSEDQGSEPPFSAQSRATEL
jgi:hypothetical protein